MLRFFVRLFATIGFLVVSALVGGAYLVIRQEPTLPRGVVLNLDLTHSLAEGGNDRLGGLLGHEASLRDALDALERGRKDARVKGVLARLGGDQIGFAQTQELRAAVERFRASGRFAIAYADSYGDGGAGNRAFLLASGFDEVWMQPLGVVGLTGLSAELPFARGLLDTLGVQPQLQHREEYKSFSDTFTQSTITPANREMMQGLIGDLTNQLVDGVAKGRRLPPASVRAAIDRAPLLEREALDLKLIDRIGYADEARDAALQRAGADAELVELPDYLAVAGGPHDNGPTIALVHIVGTITGGKSERPTFGEINAGADTVVRAIEDAADDADVRAILVRIDSGGGAVSASESIRRALAKARQRGKPVIASMGDSAASGGYWIALAADRIVASPATLTGSIGVVAGKMSLGGLSDKLGVRWDRVSAARNAGMWSPMHPFSPAEEERLTAIIDATYASFLERVAEARRLTPEQARAAAKGRVWTGAQARELGLIDELGGQEEALTLARSAAGLATDAEVTLAPYPPPKTLTDELLDLLSGKGELVGALSAAAHLRPIASALAPLLDSPGLRASMPPVGVR
ncbi:signal peptide peptidase SppA [Azospirillum griseum]|uniref:Signal peptide peptidase SppA n=1 Tax=Azospirillum griseum TaxID=2496639 RepID=A0A3S0I3V0_9PROT|nr:signal peptide peptidase SppA [Azospirillum griseum]RTR23745.1 signal peptide peptidase SppA [Azospirillum griseum]